MSGACGVARWTGHRPASLVPHEIATAEAWQQSAAVTARAWHSPLAGSSALTARPGRSAP